MEAYVGIILSIIATSLTGLGVTIAMFFWQRSESNSDRREIRAIIDEIKQENREFHGRLCSLDTRYIQMMERFMQERK